MSTRFKGLVTPGNSSSTLSENRSFPRCKNSRFRNEAKRKTFVVKMSFVCMGKKNYFHVNGFALGLALTESVGELGNSLFCYSVLHSVPPPRLEGQSTASVITVAYRHRVEKENHQGD